MKLASCLFVVWVKTKNLSYSFLTFVSALTFGACGLSEPLGSQAFDPDGGISPGAASAELTLEVAASFDEVFSGHLDASGDVWDEYEIDVQEATTLTATLSWSTNADLYLILFDPSGTRVAREHGSGTNSEVISWDVEPGVWKVAVRCDSLSADYTLHVEGEAPPSIDEVFGGHLDASGDHWDEYEIDVAEATTLTATLSWSSSADLYLILFDPSGTRVAREHGSGNNSEVITWDVEPGVWKVAVRCDSLSADYTLRVTGGGGGDGGQTPPPTKEPSTTESFRARARLLGLLWGDGQRKWSGDWVYKCYTGDGAEQRKKMCRFLEYLGKQVAGADNTVRTGDDYVTFRNLPWDDWTNNVPNDPAIANYNFLAGIFNGEGSAKGLVCDQTDGIGGHSKERVEALYNHLRSSPDFEGLTFTLDKGSSTYRLHLKNPEEWRIIHPWGYINLDRVPGYGDQSSLDTTDPVELSEPFAL